MRNLLICTAHQVLFGEQIRLRWAGHVACMGDRRRTYRIMVGRPDGKRPIGILRATWEDNIKVDPQEVERRACT